ncbi:MAG TPA: hypothetical protein VHV78_08200, partial [Gemmatimonadaceae bacterium]|nr:hypothetical protein [Gemmatimonadaceae bacterium]
DFFYDVAAQLPSNDDRRHVFIVAYRPDATYPHAATDGSQDVIVGAWTMFGVVDDGNGNTSAVKIKSGMVRQCSHPSADKDATIAEADFLHCSKVGPAQRIADSLGLALADVRDIVHAIAAEAVDKHRTMQEQIDADVCALAPRSSGCRNGPLNTVKPALSVGKLAGLTPARQVTALGWIRAANLDSMTDPYWFSCGPGCCTAGDLDAEASRLRQESK